MKNEWQYDSKVSIASCLSWVCCLYNEWYFGITYQWRWVPSVMVITVWLYYSVQCPDFRFHDNDILSCFNLCLMNSLLHVFVGVKIFGDKQMMLNHLYCHWEMRIEAQTIVLKQLINNALCTPPNNYLYRIKDIMQLCLYWL